MISETRRSPGSLRPTGACAGGPSPDGTACDDGDPCTVDDSCVAGSCTPGDLEPAACVSAFQCYDAFSWQKPYWWVGSGKVQVEDRFEAAMFKLGTTNEVCSALSLPDGQLAGRLGRTAQLADQRGRGRLAAGFEHAHELMHGLPGGQALVGGGVPIRGQLDRLEQAHLAVA